MGTDVLPSTTALVGGDCCEEGGTQCGAVTWGCSDLAGTFEVGFFSTSFTPLNPSSPVAALGSQPVASRRGFLEHHRWSSSVRVSLLKAVAAQKVQLQLSHSQNHALPPLRLPLPTPI